MKRRDFLQSAIASAALAVIPVNQTFAESRQDRRLPVRTKISLNAYSFNRPLTSGQMTMDDMIDYAAQVGFEGIDLTGYYFPGYPQVPDDDYIYHIKQKAFDVGLEICGSGVRNDFAQADPVARQAAMKHVKDWIVVASKLGGQTLRIFSGNNVPAGHSRDEAFQWVVSCINECADYAGKHGIKLAIQNHNDFLKTADQVEKLMQAIESPHVGLMLDIGSYQSADPYVEIEQTVKYAITWQLKEEVFIYGKAVKTDLDKMKDIISRSGYRGYLPIETLGEGDPKQKIAVMFEEVKKRFNMMRV
ncbi:MAG: sugar phosphate isomerase/epimerase [Tannerella sp.]|jgi:sugar phosphate isomerase/epimerase|nr:sugar phosphate isomerase/epimerase [Tannerella sp.]